MTDDENRHSRMLRTVGYIGGDMEIVYHGEVALSEIDAFISWLSPEFRRLAMFVRATAVDPEVAVRLEVAFVKSHLARFGGSGTTLKLSNVPPDDEYEDGGSLLRAEIDSRRASLLKRKCIKEGDAPQQVFLDRNAQRMTVEQVDAAFRRASKRMNLSTPIALQTIAEVVLRSSKRRSAKAAASHGYAGTSLEYYLREVLYGKGLKITDIHLTYH